ncbi:MAG: pseudouridylate synthase [Crocinitomicaceae bacterium]
MTDNFLFNFKTDISGVQLPTNLNNPFGHSIPEIATMASKEFQDFIISKSQNWDHDFLIQKGKMFGVLVVKLQNGTIRFIGTVSGKLFGNSNCEKFIPSVFDDSTDDFFINKGMTELTKIGAQIQAINDAKEITELKKARRQKSFDLQQKLFENYKFINVNGEEKNVIEIFNNFSQVNPPAASGECAAPKLLQFALKNNLRPIAIAEFWWGNSPKGQKREHQTFYPACKDKCRPILEFMLEDNELFNRAKALS